MISAAGSFEDDLRLALIMADDADALTMERFRALDLRIDTKPDLTPVTDADRTVEQRLRSTLSHTRTRDAIVGEEFGSTGWGRRRWVIDPIDGTKNFVRGVPVWATLIALMDGDDVVVGVVSAPALGRRWWAAKGAGSWTGQSLAHAQPCRVSAVSGLEDASFSYSDLAEWDTAGRGGGFASLAKSCWRTRAYGDFWSYMLVAEGAVDIAAEPDLNVYDIAALVPIVVEAGGTFTALDGTPGAGGGNAVATNGVLHRQVLAHLNGG